MYGEKFIFFVGNEVKYGLKLYVGVWKKLILHPWQTVKDISIAFSHPVKTGKFLIKEVKFHPIGMPLNIALSWATGRTIFYGIDQLIDSLHISHVNSPEPASTPTITDPISPSGPSLTLPQATGSKTTSIAPAGRVTSIISQLIQFGNLGCGCGGVCATVGQIGPTTSALVYQETIKETEFPLAQAKDFNNIKNTEVINKQVDACNKSCTSECTDKKAKNEEKITKTSTVPNIDKFKRTTGAFLPSFKRKEPKKQDKEPTHSRKFYHTTQDGFSRGCSTVEIKNSSDRKIMSIPAITATTANRASNQCYSYIIAMRRFLKY